MQATHTDNSGNLKLKASAWKGALLFCYAFIIVAFISEFMRPLNGDMQNYLRYGDALACVFLIADTLIRARRAKNKKKFWKRGCLELLTSIPNLAPPDMPLLFGVLRIIRGLRAVRASVEISRYFFGSKRKCALGFIFTILVVSICVGGLLVLNFEAGAKNANIRDSADAIWWAVSTITTVGYGDVYPVTLEGRIIGMGLMFAGISLFGTLSGLLASWFLNSTNEQIDLKNRQLSSAVSRLELENLRLREINSQMREKLKHQKFFPRDK